MANIQIHTNIKHSDIYLNAQKRKKLYIRGLETIRHGVDENGAAWRECKPHPVRFNGFRVASIVLTPVFSRKTEKKVPGLYFLDIESYVDDTMYLDGRDMKWKVMPDYDKDPAAYSEALEHAVEMDGEGHLVTIHRAYIDATAYREINKLVKHSLGKMGEMSYEYFGYEEWLADILR